MASMTKIPANVKRKANTCFVYNTMTIQGLKKLSNCTRKFLLTNEKMEISKRKKALTMTTEQKMASTMTKRKKAKTKTEKGKETYLPHE